MSQFACFVIFYIVTLYKRQYQQSPLCDSFSSFTMLNVQNDAMMLLVNMQRFAEPLLTCFGCVTTQKVLVTDQGQADPEQPPQPKINTSG